MPPSVNALRDALLDAIDARDDAVKSVAQAATDHMVWARSVVLERAARYDATEQHVKDALTADAHAVEHSERIRAAAPGRDEGPVRRAHLEARRAVRMAK